MLAAGPAWKFPDMLWRRRAICPSKHFGRRSRTKGHSNRVLLCAKSELRFNPHVLTGWINLKKYMPSIGGNDKIEGPVDEAEFFHEQADYRRDIGWEVEHHIDLER